MDKNAIGIAIHEIKQMVLVAIVAAETASDTDPRYFRLSESDTDLLSFSIFDIQERVTKLKDFSGATNAPDPASHHAVAIALHPPTTTFYRAPMT